MSRGAPRYIVNPDVSCREEVDGALLYNPDTDRVLVVNTTGLLIWQVLEQPHTLEEVVAILLERCDNVPQDQVHRDVGDFIARLQERGFIGVYGGSAA